MIKNKIRNEVRYQISVQARDRLFWRVWEQVRTQTGEQAANQVWFELKRKIDDER